jgi:hypothetical protein
MRLSTDMPGDSVTLRLCPARVIVISHFDGWRTDWISKMPWIRYWYLDGSAAATVQSLLVLLLPLTTTSICAA